MLIIHKKQENKVKSSFKKDLNKKNIIDINLKENVATLFNLRIDNGKSTYSYDEFVNFIYYKERESFKEWIEESLESDNIDYSSFDKSKLFITFINKGKNNYCRKLYTIYDINQKDMRILINSEYLFNIPLEYDKHKEKYNKYLLDYGDISKLYDNGYFLRGCAILIKIVKKNEIFSSFNKGSVKYRLLDYLYKYLDASTLNFYFRNQDELEINILDRKAVTRYSLKKMVLNIERILNKSFELTSFNSYFDFYVIGGLVSELPHDSSKMHNQLLELYKSSLFSSHYVIFESNKNSDNESHIIKNEFINITRKESIDSGFNIIIKLHSLTNNKCTNTYGYIANFTCTSKMFDNDFNKLLNAIDIYGDVRNIYIIALRKAVPRYLSIRKDFFSKLVVPIKKNYVSQILGSLNRIEGISKCHVVFLVDINDFNDNSVENSLDLIKSIHKKGFEISVLIKQFDLVINPDIYRELDSFYIYSNLKPNVKADSRDFIKIHACLERLVEFKKPLIMYESKSFTEIDLFYKAGISYFSSSILLKENDNSTEFDKKTLKKLTNIVKN